MVWVPSDDFQVDQGEVEPGGTAAQADDADCAQASGSRRSGLAMVIGQDLARAQDRAGEFEEVAQAEAIGRAW